MKKRTRKLLSKIFPDKTFQINKIDLTLNHPELYGVSILVTDDENISKKEAPIGTVLVSNSSRKSFVKYGIKDSDWSELLEYNEKDLIKKELSKIRESIAIDNFFKTITKYNPFIVGSFLSSSIDGLGSFSDVDIILITNEEVFIENSFKNKLGGFRVVIEGVCFDIWRLKDTVFLNKETNDIRDFLIGMNKNIQFKKAYDVNDDIMIAIN